MTPAGYQFEGFRIDVAKRLLLRSDGDTVPLMPKAFDTLLYLVEHPHKVLEKDLLLSEIWPDTIVEENNLTQYISVLRKALGEKPNEHRFIVTVPGRGYKFVAELRETNNLDNGRSAPDNGRPKTMDVNRRLDVEKQGNVLALIDWVEPAADPTRKTDEVAKDLVNRHLPSRRKWQTLIIGALAFLVVLSLLGFWKLRVGTLGAESTSERTYTYLTDGVEVSCPAISPDGKYFVYHSFDGEFSQMWLQQVGQSTRLEILPPIKKGIGEKTFSPDGQFVYFLAAEERGETLSLYKMPVFGKVFTRILDHINSPVSFSPDGSEITFSRYDKEGNEWSIVIAKADGSGQKVIQTGNANRLVNYPSWSPDGRLIAFGDWTLNDGSGESFCKLAGVDPGGGEAITLSPDKWSHCYRMSWTSGGSGIIFVGTKAGEGLSTRRNQVWHLELANGKATRISNEGFWHDLGGVTGDNAVLVHPYDRAAQLWAMDADGDSTSATRLTSGRSDGRAGLAPLPDGRVAYIARNNDKLELWVVNADGSGQTPVLNEPSQIEELRASPDGRYFIFLSRLKTLQLFRLNTDGSDLRQLTIDEGSSVGDPAISPDGSWIVYSAQVPGGDIRLQRVSIDGGPPAVITLASFAPRTPHFSPDGSLLSFVTGYRLALLPAVGGSPTRFFDTKGAARLNIGARWTPDGTSLTYIVHRNNVSNIWLQPINGDPPRPLTDFTSGDIYNFVFSNDGKRLFLSRGYGFSNLALIKNVIQDR